MRVSMCQPSSKKNTHGCGHRISPGSSQDPSTSQCAPLRQSSSPVSCLDLLTCRRDEDDASVVLQNCNDAVPFPTKKLCSRETAGQGRVMCLQMKASSAACGTEHIACHPSQAGREILRFHVVTSSRVRTPQRGRRCGSSTASGAVTNHAEIRVQPNTAATSRVFGNLPANS